MSKLLLFGSFGTSCQRAYAIVNCPSLLSLPVESAPGHIVDRDFLSYTYMYLYPM